MIKWYSRRSYCTASASYKPAGCLKNAASIKKKSGVKGKCHPAFQKGSVLKWPQTAQFQNLYLIPVLCILFYVFKSIIAYWTHICKTQFQQFTHEPSCFSYTLTTSSSLDYFERFKLSPWQLPLWVVTYLSDHPFHLDVMTSLGLSSSLGFLGLPQCLAHSTLS